MNSATITANQVLDNARNSISNYCIKECKAKCCRKGSLLIQSKKELFSLITENDFHNLFEKQIITKSTNNENWHIFNHEKIGGCPKLDKNNLCSIYKNEDRPKICSDFPLFKVKNFILVAEFCPASKTNLFDKYLKKLEEMGFKIIK